MNSLFCGALQASAHAKKMRLLPHSLLLSALRALDLHSLYSLPFLSLSDRVHAISFPHMHWEDFLFPPPSAFIFRYKKAVSAEWNGCNSLRSVPGGPECTVKGKKGSKFTLIISGLSTQLWALQRTVSWVKFAVKAVVHGCCLVWGRGGSGVTLLFSTTPWKKVVARWGSGSSPREDGAV